MVENFIRFWPVSHEIKVGRLGVLTFTLNKKIRQIYCCTKAGPQPNGISQVNGLPVRFRQSC